jgi:RNA polymerase sigma-70 factor (ECF subfamily)
VTNDGPKAWLASTSPPPPGDAPRFRAELAEAAPALRRFLFGLCGDWHRSEDLSQEALLSAWRKRESFDGRAGLRTWVFAIARNHWLTGLRQQARRPREQPVNESFHIGPGDAPDAAAARGELAEAVAAALHRLPDEQREALSLRELGGLTCVQVAEVLDLPLGTVKSRLRYAMLKLARELEPFAQELEP